MSAMRYLILFTLICLSTAVAAADRRPTDGDGADLYARFCADCHGRLARTEKPGRSANRIASAIRLFPAMSGLDVLSREQIESIAAALAENAS